MSFSLLIFSLFSFLCVLCAFVVLFFAFDNEANVPWGSAIALELM
ncbi:MAG: hypothetical protein ACRCT1_22235 [Microcoleaceae cyanobacterium]